MKIKIILCVMLGLYSIGAASYVLSEIYSVYAGCGAGCFGNELPFKNSTSGTRTVDVQYRATGPNGFSADSAKIAGALNTAMGDWNNANTAYQFQSAQGAGSPNLQIVVVDDLKNAPRNACMQLYTWADNPQTREISGGILYVKRSTFNNLTQTELAELLEHELGHFIGLKDFRGIAEQCQTIMAQAKDGCHGLKGSKAISNDDVASVNKYVNRSTDCKGKRGPTTVIEGGYIDPNPIPYYYPYTCYYYYSAYDFYDPETREYRYTVYVLDDVICF